MWNGTQRAGLGGAFDDGVACCTCCTGCTGSVLRVVARRTSRPSRCCSSLFTADRCTTADRRFPRSLHSFGFSPFPSIHCLIFLFFQSYPIFYIDLQLYYDFRTFPYSVLISWYRIFILMFTLTMVFKWICRNSWSLITMVLCRFHLWRRESASKRAPKDSF